MLARSHEEEPYDARAGGSGCAGAGQGIGRTSALALAEAGAHVVVADITGPLADATTEAITPTQRRAWQCRWMLAIYRTSIAWSGTPWRHSVRSTSS